MPGGEPYTFSQAGKGCPAVHEPPSVLYLNQNCDVVKRVRGHVVDSPMSLAVIAPGDTVPAQSWCRECDHGS